MTDYLEALLQEGGVLLEEMRRLERGLLNPGPAAEEVAFERNVLQKEWEAADSVPAPAGAERTALFQREKAGQADGPPDWTGERQKERPALLEQLEHLERLERISLSVGGAALREGGSAAGGTAEEKRGFPHSLSRPGLEGGKELSDWAALPVSGWPPSAGAEMEALGLEEANWAERADRAFRRDSRRYDGTFYLY